MYEAGQACTVGWSEDLRYDCIGFSVGDPVPLVGCKLASSRTTRSAATEIPCGMRSFGRLRQWGPSKAHRDNTHAADRLVRLQCGPFETTANCKVPQSDLAAKKASQGQAVAKMRKAPERATCASSGAFHRRFRQRPTLPDGLPSSTIGAGELNFRVRNVIGWVLSAMVTGNCDLYNNVDSMNARSYPVLRVSAAATRTI